jgi:hypothetical protein
MDGIWPRLMGAGGTGRTCWVLNERWCLVPGQWMDGVCPRLMGADGIGSHRVLPCGITYGFLIRTPEPAPAFTHFTGRMAGIGGGAGGPGPVTASPGGRKHDRGG